MCWGAQPALFLYICLVGHTARVVHARYHSGLFPSRCAISPGRIGVEAGWVLDILAADLRRVLDVYGCAVGNTCVVDGT